MRASTARAEQRRENRRSRPPQLAEAAVDAAVAGLGVTRVLSYQAAHAIRSGALEVVLREFEPAPWPVSLTYAGGRFLPLKVRAFIDFTVPRLKAVLSSQPCAEAATTALD
jgi:DNA-binding transcriptional LysR family regulator